MIPKKKTSIIDTEDLQNSLKKEYFFARKFDSKISLNLRIELLKEIKKGEDFHLPLSN